MCVCALEREEKGVCIKEGGGGGKKITFQLLFVFK